MSKRYLVILIFSIIVNIVLAICVFRYINQKTDQQQNSSQYQFLSKRVFIENNNDLLINFLDLRNQITNYLQDKPYLGLYFEYLPSGVSIGVNQNNPYVIASLLKVPMVMAVYHYIEKNQISLNDVLTIKTADLDNNFGDLWKRGAGTKITVKEAIELVITKSDNTALKVLVDILPGQAIDDVFDSLDISKAVDGSNDIVVTPQNYSSILRSLYLSLKLTPLSRPIFND